MTSFESASRCSSLLTMFRGLRRLRDRRDSRDNISDCQQALQSLISPIFHTPRVGDALAMLVEPERAAYRASYALGHALSRPSSSPASAKASLKGYLSAYDIALFFLLRIAEASHPASISQFHSAGQPEWCPRALRTSITSPPHFDDRAPIS